MARKSSRATGGKPKFMQAQTLGYAERIVAARDPIERFLIVCEGEETEPNYFRSFRVPKKVTTVKGTGTNTMRVVEEAIALQKAVANTPDAYHQVWCVFDRDSFPPAHFNTALHLAAKAGLSVAFSNEAFEIWYLLHFNYHEAGISRHAYKDKLTQCLGHPYEKNSETIYDELYSKQSDAIRNAKRLHQRYNPPRPEQDNPCTTVYALVEQLNRFLI